MTVDIVIRTYSKDIEWLNYALRSIHKYVTGYRHVIVAIPSEDVKLLRHLSAEKVVGVADLQDGYLGQQMTKMQAWKLTNADAIVFWDSDVVATCPIDIRSEYFYGDKIIRYKTRYSSLGSACPWQPIVAKSVGFTPEWEYMRRMPLVYWRSTLEKCEQSMVDLHVCSLEHYINAQPYRSFSEFNTLGAFSEARDPDGYLFVDTESIDMPPCKVDQCWSWGGITDEVRCKFATYGLE
jgi:hypothetical protein